MLSSLVITFLPRSKCLLISWLQSPSAVILEPLKNAQKLICRVHLEKRWAGRKQAGIKIAGRNINNLRYADDTTLIARSKEKLKSLLVKVKEKS